MSENNNDYEVGYGKPPKHTRFPKGQSGNPRGRKPGSRGLKTDLEAALNERHTISVAGQKRKSTTQELAMLTLALRAANGDLRAQKLLADLVLGILGPEDRGRGREQLSPQDQTLLDRLLSRAGEAKESGVAAGADNGATGPREPRASGDGNSGDSQ